MRLMQKAFWLAVATTVLYEITITSPWWSGQKHGRYDMLATLTLPSIAVLAAAYYTQKSSQRKYAPYLALYVIALQLATLAMLYGTISGLI